MKKSKPQDRISDHEDFHFSPPLPVSSVTFYSGIERFLNEFYVGAFQLEYKEIGNRSIIVSPMQFAFFFRTLFSEIYGKSILFLTIRENYDSTEMWFEFPPKLLSDEVFHRLEGIAVMAGMTLERRNGCLYSTFRVEEWGSALRLYSPYPNDIYIALHCLFFNEPPNKLL